jgi:hypothetical protein
MELSNLSFEQVIEFIQFSSEMNPEDDPNGVKNSSKLNELSELYSSIPLKTLLPSIFKVKFSDIKINRLGLNICIGNYSGAKNDTIINYSLDIGSNSLDFIYNRSNGLLVSIDYKYNKGTYSIKKIYEQTPYASFRNSIDEYYSFNIYNLRYFIDQINYNKLNYIKTFTPLVKAIYKNYSTIVYPIDVEEDLEGIEHILEKPTSTLLAFSMASTIPTMIFKSNVVPFSYLECWGCIAYFDEYHSITHIGVYGQNMSHHVVNVYDRHGVETLENFFRDKLKIPSLTDKFAEGLMTLTGHLDC